MKRLLIKHADTIVLIAIFTVFLWALSGCPCPAPKASPTETAGSWPWDWWPFRVVYPDQYWFYLDTDRHTTITWG